PGVAGAKAQHAVAAVPVQLQAQGAFVEAARAVEVAHRDDGGGCLVAEHAGAPLKRVDECAQRGVATASTPDPRRTRSGSGATRPQLPALARIDWRELGLPPRR